MPRSEAVAVGVDLSAGVACDKCGKKAILRVALTKLRPQIEMHLKLPPGWAASSLEDSGDLYITCPTCPPMLVTVPPPALSSWDDVATDPTMPPPPPPEDTPR
jgi:DNA-directed RNA polymerase subunit RPC12/RpoP